MKKIVSLVLALVLVLAFAAPAMAITGQYIPAETPPTLNSPFYDIDLVLTEGSASGLGVLSLQAIAANKAYIKDSIVYFALFYKTGAPVLNAVAGDYSAAVAQISSDIVTFNSTVTQYKITALGVDTPTTPVVTATPAIAPKTIEFALTQPGAAAASYVVLGSGVVTTAANGTVVAKVLGDPASLKFKPFALANLAADIALLDGSVINAGATPKYSIETDAVATPVGTAYTVNLLADTVNNPAVIFTAVTGQTIVGSTKNLSKIEVEFGGTTYLVVDQGANLAGGGTSGLKFYTSPGAVEVVDATTIANLTKTYAEVMTFFGFNYGAAGVLLPIHFAIKLSVFYATDSAAITLYTSAITVPDADTDVPQTGDAATSIGFVMIALAIVAACGVAYKKVRA